MNADEALRVLDRLLPEETLNNLQEIVFRQVWEGQTYAEIADACNYEHSYIRDVGFKLWNRLSTILNQKVTKSNVRSVLSRYARTHQGSARWDRDSSAPVVADPPEGNRAIVPLLECPNGPVPLDSPFYVERPPIEAQGYAELTKPGSLVHLRGPRQMGKTSLVYRMLAYGRSQGFHTVKLSLDRADRSVFEQLDSFLRWFCANVARQLKVPDRLEDYWNPVLGSKVSCTTYFEEYILPCCDTPIVIALDELNQLFAYPSLAVDVLDLLRSWYEDAREVSQWRKLRWIAAYATDGYVPLRLNPSLFNTGLPIHLPEFTPEQVEDLAHRHQLSWANLVTLSPLLSMVGGRPGLIRLALYYLTRGDRSLAQLMQEAPTQAGLYGYHLRYLLTTLQAQPDLMMAMQMVIKAPEPVRMEPLLAYRLENIGLVRLQGNQVMPSCQLYQRYFQEQWLAIAESA